MTDEVLASWNDGPAKQAILAFVDAVTTAGSAFVAPADRIATFDNDTVRTQARRLLAASDRPDAVLAGADGFALPMLQIAQELGLNVGTDLLVASCIDNPLLRSVPGITAIEAPPRDIGRDAGRALLDILSGQDVPPELRRQEPTIALRGSTAGPVKR